MKKNKVLLALCSVFPLLFLGYVFKLTFEIRNLEKTLNESPNVIDVTDKITTKLLVTSSEYPDDFWARPTIDDSVFKTVKIPKHRIVQEPEYKEGNFAYYRVHIPKKSFYKLKELRNELAITFQYVNFSKLDIYLNGVFQRSSTPKSSTEFILNVPIDDSKDNLVAIKGYLKNGDLGVNHRGAILVGEGVVLNDLYSHIYKADTVYPLIFILCKGSVFLVFALIFLVLKVETYFEKSLFYSFFVIAEDFITGDFLHQYLNLTNLVYLYDLTNLGINLFLFLFLADVLQEKYSKKLVGWIFGGVALFFLIVSLDLLQTGYFFNIDMLLKLWNCVLMAVMLFFIPRLFKSNKILFFGLSLAFSLNAWSTFFSGQVGYNLKVYGTLGIFFAVAYQTFLLFRRQQNQLFEQEKDVAIGRTAAILAHDVRKPLDQMSIILNRISSGDFGDEFLKVAKQDVEFSLTSVNNQINDIMNFSRISEVPLGPISFYRVLASSIRQVMTVSRNVDINLTYDFQAPVLINGEESRLSSALTNLISNAIEAIRDIGKLKAGEIHFKTYVTKDYFCFSIFNNGPRIPYELIDHIFEPLTTYGKSKGTGLGLASVAKVLRDHNGTIEVENMKNGVQFILKLGFLKEIDGYDIKEFLSKLSQYQHFEKVEELSPVGFIRLLLVDDDKYVFEYVCNLIKDLHLDIEVSYFPDLSSAKEVIRKKRFDLHILDYDLNSSENGIDFIKSELLSLKTVIALHSSRKLVEDIPSNVNFISKPIQADQFIKLCKVAEKSRERILLVEDSKIITVGWKIYHGKHNLQAVSTPEEALSFLSATDRKPDICVLDVNFEGSDSNGYDLGYEIRRIYPNIKVIICSSNSVSNSDFLTIRKTRYEIRDL